MSNRASKPATGSKSQRLAPSKAADDAANLEPPVTSPTVTGDDAVGQVMVHAMETAIRDGAERMAPIIAEVMRSVNPPDLNGNGEPGGSLPDLAWKLAPVAWAACHEWATLNGLERFSEAWADMPDDERLKVAVEVNRCIQAPLHLPMFEGPEGSWESEVRGKLFARRCAKRRAVTDSRSEDVLRRQSALEAERANLDSHCMEIAERVLPTHEDFHGARRTTGGKRSEKVFDSTAALALDRFAASIGQLVTPSNSQWHELSLRDFRGLGGQRGDVPPEYKQLLATMNRALFDERYRPRTNFGAEIHSLFLSLGAFGNGSLYIDERPGEGLRYRSIPFAETWWAENHQGMVDTVHRKTELEARQWVQKFGDETPEAIKRAADKEPYRKFELIHCVQPREDADWSKMDYRGMAFASYYVAFEGRKLLRERGYYRKPYAVARYTLAPREVYGRSPAMTVLPDIKTANEQAKTLLRTGQLVAEPPLLISDDGSVGGVKLQPGALNYGGLDINGNELIKPLQIGANMPITMESLGQTRDIINMGFLVTLFQILVDNGEMTATEAMLRAQEKGALLAPVMYRLQSELLGPLIEAELDIMSRADLLPPLPPEFYDDEAIKVDYTSPLARAQMAEVGIGIQRTIEAAAPVLEIDPSAKSIFTGKGAAIIRRIGEIFGHPADLLNTDDEIEKINAANAAEAQAGNTLAGAEVAASVAKNLAQAQSMMGSAPSQPAPALLEAL